MSDFPLDERTSSLGGERNGFRSPPPQEQEVDPTNPTQNPTVAAPSALRMAALQSADAKRAIEFFASLDQSEFAEAIDHVMIRRGGNCETASAGAGLLVSSGLSTSSLPGSSLPNSSVNSPEASPVSSMHISPLFRPDHLPPSPHDNDSTSSSLRSLNSPMDMFRKLSLSRSTSGGRNSEKGTTPRKLHLPPNIPTTADVDQMCEDPVCCASPAALEESYDKLLVEAAEQLDVDEDPEEIVGGPEAYEDCDADSKHDDMESTEGSVDGEHEDATLDEDSVGSLPESVGPHLVGGSSSANPGGRASAASAQELLQEVGENWGAIFYHGRVGMRVVGRGCRL